VGLGVLDLMEGVSKGEEHAVLGIRELGILWSCANGCLGVLGILAG